MAKATVNLLRIIGTSVVESGARGRHRPPSSSAILYSARPSVFSRRPGSARRVHLRATSGRTAKKVRRMPARPPSPPPGIYTDATVVSGHSMQNRRQKRPESATDGCD